MSSDIRIDLEGIRMRAALEALNMGDLRDLINEVKRLDEVNQRWANGWKKIVQANTEAFMDRIKFLEGRVEELEKLL